MNLDRCTSGQREIITTLDAPLMVAAGAGSGKTFTLTQRIVGALLPHDGHPAPLDSINQVLAITFTKKAASELKGRIKSLLLAEGLRDQALAVDGAWISTIHGMASRILREHALELGIDPAFEVISEARSEELRAEAAEAVARAVEDDPDPLMRELLAKTPLMSEGGRGDSVVDQALRVLARLEAMPEGFDGLVLAPSRHTPGELMRELFELGCAFKDTAAAWSKATATDQKYLDALDAALEGAQKWLEESGDVAFDSPSFDADAFRKALYAFPPTTAKYRVRKDDAEFFARYRSDYARISREVEACVSQRAAQPLVRFARMVSDEFARLKGPSRLDNTDLLGYAARALKSHPEIARGYREQFKLIMVDEFQDTDKLQVSVIRALAQPGLANVCVVGDAQQGIYRFRGADVNVFFEYRDSLRSANPQARFVSLPDNFRSHGDVLALVDAVFSRPEVFGREFLHLEPRASVNGQADPLFAQHPRVCFDVLHNKRTTPKAKGVSKSEAVEVAACHIAAHFAELRRRGARAGEMALLLGSMSNAGVYAAALRRQGIESVVAGGSVFASSAEALLVSALLRYAVNAEDEPALFAVLTSGLFVISDDVLLALASDVDESGQFKPRSLARGFADRDGHLDPDLSRNDADALAMARETLGRFAARARTGDAAGSLRALLVQTGMLDRLGEGGSAGFASAGNFAKALALVGDFQDGATGIAGISRAYDDHLRCSKEAPGSLATVDADFVRIMTVHASKGLEFPHVAIADMGTGRVSRAGLLAENVGDHTYVAISASASGETKKTVDALRTFERADEPCSDPASAQTPGELYDALDAHMRHQELAEAQRLLYVALTRASRSVYMSIVSASNPQDRYEKEGIYRDLFTALGWDVETDASVSMVDYGGSAPARITFAYLKTPENLEGDGSRAGCANDVAHAGNVRDEADGRQAASNVVDGTTANDASGGAGDGGAARSANDDGIADDSAMEFTVPLRDVPSPPLALPHTFGREGIFSYSSLEHDAPDSSLLADNAPCGGAELARGDDDEETALGLAFHRVAQRAVITCSYLREEGASAACLEHPGPRVVHAQSLAHDLSHDQAIRLEAALDRWFASELAREAASFKSLKAEVPFMVEIALRDEASDPLFLEGEVDLLAANGDGHALVIDYKTGGFAFETPAYLHEKHLLQAQCYAYALFREGYKSVEARFVRVEQPDPCDPAQPQVVSYCFDAREEEELARVLCMQRRRGA